MKRPLITGMEDEETKAPTNSQELEDSIEKNNPANTSLPPSFSLEEELRQADEEAIKALESTTDADPVPSSLPVEEDDNAQKIKAAMAQSEAGKLTDKDATKFGAIPTSTESIKNQNYYQDILQNYAKLKDAQAGRRDSMANIGMLSAADELSASVARGYGGQRKVDPNSYKPFYDMADQPVQDIEQGMKLGKEAASISEMEEMANPNSDVSKLYREQAYALLKKLGKNEYEGKLEEMSANQLMKLPGMKNLTNILNPQANWIATDRVDSQGNPIRFNKQTGEYSTSDGSVIKPGDYTARDILRRDQLTGQYAIGNAGSGMKILPTNYKSGMIDIHDKSTKNSEIKYSDIAKAAPEFSKKIDKLRDDFNKDMKDSREIATSVTNLSHKLTPGENNKVDSGLLGGIQTQAAKMAGQKGVLTDQDLVKFAGAGGVKAKLERLVDGSLFGNMTEDDIKFFKRFAVLMGESLNEDILNRSKLYVEQGRQSLETIAPSIKDSDVSKMLGVDKVAPIVQNKEVSTDKVKIQLPDGKTGFIPKENLKKALEKGAKEIK